MRAQDQASGHVRAPGAGETAAADARLIATLREGALAPDVMLRIARTLVSTDDGREAFYDGAREHVVGALRSEGLTQAELEELKDLMSRIAALAWGSAPTDQVDPFQRLALRLEVLRDLSADNLAYQDDYAVDHLRGLPHFERCLSLLYDHGGSLSRRELLRGLKLKEANGTRVLKVLEKSRLVTRTRSSTVDVALTALGKKVAMAWRSPPSNDRAAGGGAPGVVRLHMERLPGMAGDSWEISGGQKHKVG